jgi:hypothetical protein
MVRLCTLIPSTTPLADALWGFNYIEAQPAGALITPWSLAPSDPNDGDARDADMQRFSEGGAALCSEDETLCDMSELEFTPK